MRLSRRAVLVAAGAAVGVSAVGCRSGGAGSDAAVSRAHWTAVAVAARKEHPDLSAGDVAAASGLSRSELADPETISAPGRARVGSAIADDFARGATLSVGGWLLAATEVRLALAIDEARS